MKRKGNLNLIINLFDDYFIFISYLFHFIFILLLLFFFRFKYFDKKIDRLIGLIFD